MTAQEAHMTRAQEILRQYVASRFHLDGIRIMDTGADKIRITDMRGDSMDLTMNLYCDILEVFADGRTKLIAESDVPHDLMQAGLKLPTAWADVPYRAEA
jgi:hypothetical protein